MQPERAGLVLSPQLPVGVVLDRREIGHSRLGGDNPKLGGGVRGLDTRFNAQFGVNG